MIRVYHRIPWGQESKHITHRICNFKEFIVYDYCKQEKEKEHNSEGCTYMFSLTGQQTGEIMPGLEAAGMTAELDKK